jgi:hypothetical protein
MANKSSVVLLQNYWAYGVIFFSIVTLSIFGFCWLPGGMHFASALLSILLGLVGVVLTARYSPPRQDVGDCESNWLAKWLVIIVFTLFSLRAFGWHVILRNDDFCVLSPNNLSDFPLHVHYINYFAHGAEMWPNNPFKAGVSIGYPFGVDLFNSVLTVLGLDLVRGIVWVGFAACLATGVALYAWGRWIALATFLFHGGTVGWAFLNTGEWIDYQQTVDWKSLPLSLFITQRGFLYAIPAGLLLLQHWKRIEYNPNGARLLPTWLEILIFGSMPLFHLHTFLFLATIQFARLFWSADRTRVVRVITWAFLPASYLIYLLTKGFKSVSHINWLAGWLQGENFSIFYWFKNFGAYPFVFLWIIGLLLYRLRSKEELIALGAKRALLFVGPAFAVFVACLFFKFAPWAWDNTKFFAWCIIVIVPFLWSESISRGSLALKLSACFVLFFSGFISLFGGLGSDFKGYGIAKRSEIVQVGHAVKALPIEAVFASAQEHAHPLVFNGRRLVLGFNGHMVGHGLNVDKERDMLNKLMNGADDWRDAAVALGVEYIFWGRLEKSAWPESKMPWAKDRYRFTSGDWGDIYRVEAETTLAL